MYSLRRKIAIFMGISCLLALLAGCILTFVHYEGKIKRKSAQELNAYTRTAPAMLETVGNSMAALGRSAVLTNDLLKPVRDHDNQALFSFLVRLISVNELNYAEITDRQGLVVLNLADSLAAGQLSVNPLVRVALTGNPFGYGILRDRDLVVIAATLPIQDGGALLGTLTLGRTFDRKFMQDLGSLPGVSLAAWNNPRTPAIVPVGSDPLPAIQQLLSDKEIARLISGEGIAKYIIIKGKHYQISFFSMPELGADYNHFYAAYRSMQFLIEAGRLTMVHVSALVLLILLLMIQFVFWISKRMTRPLEDLTRMTARLAEFDFEEDLPVISDDEIGKLAGSFNELSNALNVNIQKKDRYAEELADLNADLECLVARRTEELKNSNLRLKREIDEKNDFLRAVSHDLSAPLRNIGGLVRLMEKKYAKKLDDDVLDKLHRIQKNVTSELEMIHQLLELSRLRTCPKRAEIIDLMELLTQIRQNFSATLEEKDIRLNIIDILPKIKANRDRVRQLFQNLMDNAVKYLGDQPEPEISIGWSENPEEFLFWVTDNGIGIPADKRYEIFNVFRRIRKDGTEDSEGMGVGLTMVKSVVELYGGDIWVESELGAGSTFYFTMKRSLTDPRSDTDQADETITENDLTEDYAEDLTD